MCPRLTDHYNHGLGKARYLGLERNKARAQLIAMSHNLKTGMNINEYK